VIFQLILQNEIDELGGKWQLQRGVDSCKAVGMGRGSRRVATLVH
jgi:hypothetical protein